jgi:hypothetical protein
VTSAFTSSARLRPTASGYCASNTFRKRVVTCRSSPRARTSHSNNDYHRVPCACNSTHLPLRATRSKCRTLRHLAMVH